MFCSEPIQKVYYGQHESDDYGDACFDCYYDMAMHLSGRNRFLMETAHFYISLEVSGVSLIIKEGGIESIQRENEWIEPCIHEEDDPELAPWVDYEATVFNRERLLSVEKEGEHYILRFDDFTMQLIPHPVSDGDLSITPHSYARVLGAERLIHKCKCGGTGILEIDFVSDYGIRCDRCHLGTSASMNACDAIDEWNEGIGLYTIGLYPEESFAEHCHEKITELRIEEFYSKVDEHTIKCRGLLAVYEDRTFLIKSRYGGMSTREFEFSELSGFNSKVYPKVIPASHDTPIKYIHRKMTENGTAEMVFTVGDKKATLVSDDHGWLFFQM